MSTPTPAKPWLDNYPPGVAANINVDTYPNLKAMVAAATRRFSKRKAYTFMGTSVSYREVDELSTQLAAYLQSRGLEPGDRFALMMPNLPQYPIALFACFKAGLVVVNTNPLYTPREMQHQFVDSGVKGIIIAENFAANLEKILPQTRLKTILTTSIGGMLGLKGAFVNFAVRNVKRMVPAYTLPNAVTFKEAIRAGKGFELQPFEATAEDVAVHQYTGGTTGVSKGAMLTHRNLMANALQSNAWMHSVLADEQDLITLCPLPLYHIFAFTVNCLSMLNYGAETVLIANPRDLDTVVSAFNDHRVNLLTGVNTLFNALAHSKKFASADTSHLRVVIAGGMALQSSVGDHFQAVSGCPVAEGYGMTEASPVVSVNPIDGTHRQGTIGLPLPSTSVRVVDERGRVLGFGEVGELQVQGPQVMKGYYNRPEETAKVLREGWLSTGDMATLDADGYLKIVDRKKDMILVSGFNVYPNEVEDVLAAHPKVTEVAVVGVPDEKSGEVVKAFVVRNDPSLTEEELDAYTREQLAGYKRPKRYEWREELPKTNVGKILRRALREQPRS